MKLIVGLGNPGLRYRNTRHNIGFMTVEAFGKRHGIRINKALFDGISGEGTINGQKTVLLLPRTYMNLSGNSVKAASGIIRDLSNLLVVYDDVDLLIGHIRFRAKGSSGGHKGLHSIIERLGTEKFPRLRIGIRPDAKAGDTSAFVLKPFLKSEKKVLDGAISAALDGIGLWISQGIEACMARFNRKQGPDNADGRGDDIYIGLL